MVLTPGGFEREESFIDFVKGAYFLVGVLGLACIIYSMASSPTGKMRNDIWNVWRERTAEAAKIERDRQDSIKSFFKYTPAPKGSLEYLFIAEPTDWEATEIIQAGRE